MDNHKSNLYYRPKEPTQTKQPYDIDKRKSINQEEENTSGTYKSSKLLESLASNSPSKTLLNTAKAIKSLKEVSSIINNNLKDEEGYKEYIEALHNEDWQSVDEFEDKHANDINGKVEAELSSVIYILTKDLEYLEKSIKTFYYSNIEDIGHLIKKDKQMIDTLIDIEKNNNGSINYNAIYYDSQINNIVSSAAIECSGVAYNALGIIDYNQHINQDNINQLITSCFCDSNKVCTNDKVKLNQSLRSSLYSSCIDKTIEARKKSTDNLTAAINLDSINDNYLKDMISDSIINSNKEARNKILDFAKINHLRSILLRDYLETIERKNTLRMYSN